MKIGRGGVGSAALGGFIYAIGGHNATHYLNSVEIYDVNQDRYFIYTICYSYPFLIISD